MDAKDQGTVLLEKMRGMQQATDPGQFLPNADGAGNVEHAEDMPGHYYTPDKSDDIVKLRNQLATLARPIPLSDAEIGSYMRKMAAVETAKFDQWFQGQWSLDSANPVLQKWGQEVNPEYFARREQVIDEQTRIQNMLAKIKLRGVHNREEMELLYMIDNGIVKIPKGPVFKHTGRDGEDAKVIRRGLFNPFRVNSMARRAGYHDGDPLSNFPERGTAGGLSYDFRNDPPLSSFVRQ